MRQVAAEKAKPLWHKKKEKEKADAEAEHKKRELLRIQAEQQRLKELAIANECKKHKGKLKQELKNEIKLKCMKEKEILEMNEIKEKFAEELEMQVHKEMGLPTTPLSQLPRPVLDVHCHDSPTHVTPSSLLSIKREKLEIADLTDPPPTNTPRGDNQKDTGNMSHQHRPPNILPQNKTCSRHSHLQEKQGNLHVLNYFLHVNQVASLQKKRTHLKSSPLNI